MGQALYRKYRSKSLSEIVGQEHITKALAKALETDRISHAYLFTGPRGIGKTSIARILAFEVNKLPYDENTTHLDIVEIDAASNRRIDEVRDLREKVHIAPTSAKYKVYIIDEVHMLTREAFNALLKTLEEPPAHVIFILATTEAHKLPETIISRTQHFTFKPIERGKVAEHLKEIANAENITIDNNALQLIAEHGGGSFRDSISLLDQIQHSSDAITADDIRAMLGIAPDTVIETIQKFIDTGDAKGLINTLQELRQQGIEPEMLAKQLGAALRSRLIIPGQSVNSVKDIYFLNKLIELPASVDPYATLELILLEMVFYDTPANNHKTIDNTALPIETKKPKPTPSEEEAPKPEKKDNPAPKSAPAPKPEPAKIPEEQPAPKNNPEPRSDADLSVIWPEVISIIKKQYNTLYGVLRMAQPSFTANTVSLTVKFAFHQKRLNEPKNKQIIADAILQISGAAPEIICTVGETSTAPVNNSPATTDDSKNTNSMGTISNIFGGAELLES